MSINQGWSDGVLALPTNPPSHLEAVPSPGNFVSILGTTEEHGILEMQRPFPNLQQGTTMLFSIIKASGKVIFVSGDRYGYVELMCMSFMSVAFILWRQQVF